MKQLYQALEKTLQSSPAIRLAGLEKAKAHSAGLFALLGSAEAAAGKQSAEDHRIKVFVTEIKAGSRQEAAARLLRTAIPDVKIFTIGELSDQLPEICDGVLTPDPENALFARKNMQKLEQIELGPKAGAILSSALTLASRPDYREMPLLIYLPEE